jgi:SHS2 domain-containing protein
MARHYRLLDHTADLGFRCEGKTREDLFAHAALALDDIIATADHEPTETRELDATGADDQALLRALLDEVLFSFERDGFLAKEAKVAFEDGRVHATLRGRRVDLATHPIDRVVKAVTYHGLEVERTKKGWRATVILDL